MKRASRKTAATKPRQRHGEEKCGSLLEDIDPIGGLTLISAVMVQALEDAARLGMGKSFLLSRPDPALVTRDKASLRAWLASEQFEAWCDLVNVAPAAVAQDIEQRMSGSALSQRIPSRRRATALPA